MSARRALSRNASVSEGAIRFKEEVVMKRVATLSLLAGCAILIGATLARAQGPQPSLAQVVALDECDPDSFNTALGESGTGFCHNVALATFGYATSLSDLLNGAETGSPDPGWDFEPDKLVVKQGTVVSVVDQGGEPHTFTEVKAFGNGFLAPLNPGSSTSVIPECNGWVTNNAACTARVLAI